jgi:hypothetical protein
MFTAALYLATPFVTVEGNAHVDRLKTCGAVGWGGGRGAGGEAARLVGLRPLPAGRRAPGREPLARAKRPRPLLRQTPPTHNTFPRAQFARTSTLPGFIDVLVSSIWALFSLGVGGACAAGLGAFAPCSGTAPGRMTGALFPFYGRRLLQYGGGAPCGAWGLAVAVG